VHEDSVNEDLLEGYERTKSPVWRVYEPMETAAVLGASCIPSRDLIIENLDKDGGPSRFRKGGGGAVILSLGQVVLALVVEVGDPFSNREYAHRINQWIMDALSGMGVAGIDQCGISDLAIRGRKIVGTSIYRRKLLLFYQASLLVSNDISLFSRYLAMPVRIPDYREGRGHVAFCTTLAREGYSVSTADVIAGLASVVERRIGVFR
jgi:lipoate-protein ligase A